MVEVGSKLVDQFAQNLRQMIAEDGAAGGSGAATAAADTPLAPARRRAAPAPTRTPP